MDSKIEVKKEDLKKLFDTLTNYPQISKEQVEHEMKKTFGDDVFKPKDIKERVKTFEDACRELGDEHPFVKEWHLGENLSEDLEAYLKLRVIVAAFNEGWKPEFTEDKWRYYPWFWLYTQDEINNMPCEEKERRNLQIKQIGHYAGFAFADTYNVPSYTYAYVGSRLCLKNSELATYCGKQFIEFWMKFTTVQTEK